MPKYMISFNDGDMQFPMEELPAVAVDAHAVMQEAIDAGAWIFGGGFEGYSPRVVTQDGTVTSGPLKSSEVYLGGFAVLKAADDAEANEWARKFSKACRCPQEVRVFMDDPEQDALLS